jgi:hypothetical protein
MINHPADSMITGHPSRTLGQSPPRPPHRTSLAGLPTRPRTDPDPLRVALGDQAGQLAAWFDHLASRLDKADHSGAPMLAPPDLRDSFPLIDTSDPGVPRTLWVNEHLEHIRIRLAELVQPATEMAAQRHRPWWR